MRRHIFSSFCLSNRSPLQHRGFRASSLLSTATASASIFTGFPRTATANPSLNANATLPSPAAVEDTIHKVLSLGPKERIVACQKALLKIKRNASYVEAQKWEAKALASAEKYPFRVLWCIFAGLLAQNVLMTYWVFVAFDWNLVEPCTYFLGYTSLTWFALVFYKYTGKEFTYDAMIEEMKRRKFNKLCAKNAQYCEVLADFRHKEEVLKKELESMGGTVE